MSLLALVGSCKDMKLDIQDSKDRLDVLEGTTITTINEQIIAINSSITDLQSMDETLGGYIKTLETTAADLQKQINDANAEIAKVESELGEEISALEQSLLDELNSAKEAIQAELLAINKTLDDLKAADTALDKKISDLRTYVDTELASTKDWANATFSTLTQYEQTQTEISAIKASIEQINAEMAALEARLNSKIAVDIKTAIDALRAELNADHVVRIESAVNNVTTAYSAAISSAKSEITSAYTAAISSAISASESNLKTWVGEQLTQGYYDIATLDGILSALATRLDETDTDLQKQIDEQKEALQQAKVDLANEYKQYINQAIASGGIIDQAIATQIKKAQDNLQSQIDIINSRLDVLEDRLDKLEEDFVNRIQSLKYVPEYSDRVALMSDLTKSVLVEFLVTPMSQAALLVSEWKRDNTIIEAYLRYTKVPETRAASQSVPLSISSVSSSEDGLLSVTLRENPSYPFSDDFLTGNNPAVIYLHISDGNTEILSDLVDVRIFEDEASSIVLSPYSDGKYQTANCYIVSAAGTYSFKAFKGNSQELAGTSHEDHPAGDISNAVVLWETFGTDIAPATGDLIKSVIYSGEEITFRTVDTFKEGNAVIAARDANGNILWSWHIWLTDQPQEHVYNNDAGTMMDRNLGATSATKGDVGALGLRYQWGRKDPFLGSSSIRDDVEAKSTIAWPSTVSSNSSNGTIEYATAHPTTFITYNNSNGDWYYTGDSSTGNTRWTTSETVKSIYDPCPAGWRVPDGGSNGIWSKAGFDYTTYDSTNEGMSFSISSPSTTWYPASGCRLNAGGLSDVGYSGFCWSASPDGYFAYHLIFDYDGYVDPSFDNPRASGFSVRCLQESK